MKCPYCGHADSSVLDSRDAEDFEITRRRRECSKCGKRFTTYERVEMVNLLVHKKDGKSQQFERNKLEGGIVRACEKRPVTRERIGQLVDEIERELRRKKSTEIASKEIGEIVMRKLKTIDKVAYIRFASVYREFADVEDFEDELHKLLKRK
ncbi:transcriptional regulator NrdR [Candidatus Micrarchaeota archaeon]|nr:transcriptional regulator NrdR [Candidatus Micrarchaeota archaeon]